MVVITSPETEGTGDKVSLVDSENIRADAVEESASYTTDGGQALVCVAFPETDGSSTSVETSLPVLTTRDSLTGSTDGVICTSPITDVGSDETVLCNSGVAYLYRGLNSFIRFENNCFRTSLRIY